VDGSDTAGKGWELPPILIEEFPQAATWSLAIADV
jgi:hypothetical protein